MLTIIEKITIFSEQIVISYLISKSSIQNDPFYGYQLSFCPWPLLSLANTLINKKGHCSRNGGYLWAQQYRPLLIWADLDMASIECLICPWRRLTLNPDRESFPGAINQLPAILTGQCLSQNFLFLQEQTLVQDIDFPIQHIVILQKLPLMDCRIPYPQP